MTLRTVLTVLDPLVIVLAFAPSRADHGWASVLAAAVVGAVTARLVGLQQSRLVLSVLRQLPWLLVPAATATATLVATSPVLDRDHGWAQAIGYLLLVFALLSLLRTIAYSVARLLRRTPSIRQPAVVVGADELGRQVSTLLLASPQLGLRPVGIVDCGSRVTSRGLPLPHLGRLDTLPGVLVEHHATTVIFACSDPPEDQPVDAVHECRQVGYRVYVVAGTYPAASREQGSTEVIGDVHLVRLPRGGVSALTRALRWTGRLFGVWGAPPAGAHRGSPGPTGADETETHARELAR